MHHFCTYFDRNYLLRGLTMYRSLKDSGFEFVLHALALDTETFTCIRSLDLDDLRPIALEEIEEANPDLIQKKTSRSRIEYYFTLSPFLPLHVLDRYPNVNVITYVDADLYFYESPAPIYQELDGRSILICEHRYAAHLKKNEKYGRFNVQFQVFRRDSSGIACLQRWRAQCLNWCYDRAEDGKYADQAYLDEWPSLYGDSLAVLQHPGAGVAPWNWSSAPLALNDDKVTVDGKPLIFYHFHGVKIFNRHLISNGLADWGIMPYGLTRWFYARYVRRIRETQRWLFEESGFDLPMKDNFIRGKGLKLASLGEIGRKAVSQAMIIP
jgi:hypothetical protein